MIDNGHMDQKIIAIPYEDPNYNVYHDITDLPAHIFEEMRHFFQIYKSLENKETAVNEVESREAAIDIINECIAKYQEKFC